MIPALLLALLVGQTLVSVPDQLQKLSADQARLLIDAGQVSPNAVAVEFIICGQPLSKWGCNDSGQRWRTWITIGE